MTGVEVGDLPAPMSTLPGSLLTQEAWLADRVDQTARQWGCDERRTNATLWWYSASAVLLGPAVRSLLLTGTAERLTPAEVRFTLRRNGYLERVIPGSPLSDPAAPDTLDSGEAADAWAAFGAHLDAALDPIIAPLARTGGAGQRSLWAIAADSLATVVLTVTTVLPGGAARAPEIATAIAAGSDRLRPWPRFVDIPAKGSGSILAEGSGGIPAEGSGGRTGGAVRYVRRGSCCLLLRVPDGKCITCPRQTPPDRLERLTRHARSQADMVWDG